VEERTVGTGFMTADGCSFSGRRHDYTQHDTMRRRHEFIFTMSSKHGGLGTGNDVICKKTWRRGQCNPHPLNNMQMN